MWSSCSFALGFCLLVSFSVSLGARASEGSRSAKPKAQQQHHHHPPAESRGAEDDSIEDVDEDKIDEIIRDGSKHLVILFYDSKGRCPGCAEALSELEEIDDDLEAVGFIEVVKTDDRNVAKEFGIKTFPSLVYLRRKSPILYDGEFKDSDVVLRWIRARDEVATVTLEDDDFEDHTDSASPAEGALDWFVMFYNSKDEECSSHLAAWETAAHKLRGLVHVGGVDVHESDDVAERFSVDDDDACPTFLLFHRGKMYRYKDSAKDSKSFVAFALYKFKEQRGHRVPDPPTLIEEFYEELKEETVKLIQENKSLSAAIGVAVFLVIFSMTVCCLGKAFRKEKTT